MDFTREDQLIDDELSKGALPDARVLKIALRAIAYVSMVEERERCAQVAEAEDVAPTDDAVGVQQCIAASIRRA